MSAPAANSILFAATEVDERLLECFASFGATFVRTFEEAQSALREELFRLIVIDLNFDRVRMVDLLAHVRSLARFNGVPVVCVLGADASAGAVQRICGMIDAEPEVKASAPRRLCILVIDPDVDAAQRLGERLEELGHEVDFAYSAAAGIDAARRLRPDAVFVDVARHAQTGWELARRLRECDPALFLVALAHAPDAEERRRMREAGFDDHADKSADRHALERLLEARHAHTER
jgi:CheY-like chemotaxis protein